MDSSCPLYSNISLLYSLAFLGQRGPLGSGRNQVMINVAFPVASNSGLQPYKEDLQSDEYVNVSVMARGPCNKRRSYYEAV